MNHITAFLTEVRERRAKLDALITSLEAYAKDEIPPPIVERARAPKSRKQASRRQNNGSAAPRFASRESHPPGPVRARGWSVAGVMRDLVAKLPEPFSVVEVTAAILAEAPELEKRLKDGVVRGNLAYWESTGHLIIVEPGRPKHPTKFKRSAKFGSEDQRPGVGFRRQSSKEVAYAEFRKTVKVPTEQAEEE